MDNKVKCHIINADIAIFEYEILEGIKTFQIELISKSNKRYIIGNYKTLKEAKEYIKNILRVDVK